MGRMICFDLGGVLIHITHRWHEAAQHAGVSISEAVPIDADLIDAPMFLPYQSGLVGDAEYLDSLGLYLGEVGREAAARVHNHIMLWQHEQVEDLVRTIQENGVKAGCLSNTNELHWEEMLLSDRFPVIPRLDLRMASHILKVQKPDTAAYREFERESGSAGHEIVFFDDNQSNLDASAQHGWQTWKINPNLPTADQIRAGLNKLTDLQF
jgi:HAD superfamily hydrolase (TIGR01509 family)